MQAIERVGRLVLYGYAKGPHAKLGLALRVRDLEEHVRAVLNLVLVLRLKLAFSGGISHR